MGGWVCTSNVHICQYSAVGSRIGQDECEVYNELVEVAQVIAFKLLTEVAIG